MNPATRKIRKVEVADIGVAETTFQNLMGADSSPKKEFVFGNEIKEIM